jgi:hypothetical protein
MQEISKVTLFEYKNDFSVIVIINKISALYVIEQRIKHFY